MTEEQSEKPTPNPDPEPKKPSPQQPETPAPRVKRTASGRPWRKNVLTLVGAGYGTILIVFGVLAAGELKAPEAYDAVQGPLMALVGGSLAIAKDLLQLDRAEDLTHGDE